MKFARILPDLLKGKKVRRCQWHDNCYVQLLDIDDLEGKTLVYNDMDDELRSDTINADEITAEDWKLFECDCNCDHC